MTKKRKLEYRVNPNTSNKEERYVGDEGWVVCKEKK